MLVSLLTLAIWDIILLVTAFFKSLPANQRYFRIIAGNKEEIGESFAASLNGLHSFSYMTSVNFSKNKNLKTEWSRHLDSALGRAQMH